MTWKYVIKQSILTVGAVYRAIILTFVMTPLWIMFHDVEGRDDKK